MSKIDRPRVLVIAAHPDDETFGCGGTMATLASQGADVSLLVVTCHPLNTGSSASRGQPASRENELVDAAKALNVGTVEVMNRNIQHTDVLYPMLPELIGYIERGAGCSLDDFRPHVVLMPARGSFHQDHQLVSQAAFAACRNRGGSHWLPSTVLGYACPEDQWSQAAEQYTTFADVTDCYPAKRSAIDAYSKQLKEGAHPRTLSGIESADRANGSRIGVEYAEALFTYRNILRLGSLL